jgi:hypothetical protein
MTRLLQFFLGQRLTLRATRSAIRGGANTGNRDNANAWYYWDGRQ